MLCGLAALCDAPHSKAVATALACSSMSGPYKIFRKLDSGELLWMALRDSLEEAEQLVESFSEHWPGEYVIREDADLEE